MSVSMSGEYLGGLKVELHHEPSGTRIRTAAPVDNQGDGSSFSPTDLCAVSLGSCMLTIMAIVGERDGLDMSGMRFRCEKHMQASPRRIGSIPIHVDMPKGLSAEARTKLEKAALSCPVFQSLSPEIAKDVQFHYPD